MLKNNEDTSMLAHIGFYVSDLKKSNEFYEPLLKSIGYEIILQIPNCIAYGKNGVPWFEIYTGKEPTSPFHIAFNAHSQQEVENFYDFALKLGAHDNGKPGFRDYFPGYYAAFIIDPHNGHNLELLYWKK